MSGELDLANMVGSLLKLFLFISCSENVGCISGKDVKTMPEMYT